MDVLKQFEKYRRKKAKRETRIRNEASKQLQNKSLVYSKKGSMKYSPRFNKQGYPWIEPYSNLKSSGGVRDTTKEKTFPSISTKPKCALKKELLTPQEIIELPKVESSERERSDSRIMLRRPTQILAEPILETEDSFQSLAKSIELKSILIDQSPAKTYEFYRTHYPLLLEKSGVEDREKIFHNRNFVRETPEQQAKRRSREMYEKLENLHEELRILENEMTDGKFHTELRNKMFDPRIWPWNKQRYTQPINFYD